MRLRNRDSSTAGRATSSAKFGLSRVGLGYWPTTDTCSVSGRPAGSQPRERPDEGEEELLDGVESVDYKDTNIVVFI